ncbi:uncharacterized protein VNE69_06018 [Vairimorpha necatrix]|uniref:Uncharacterized protein n=1 Tax=Vairimorpha necatrix TaxID=6039 RepID=A0AAX4JCF6_9MICR
MLIYSSSYQVDLQRINISSPTYFPKHNAKSKFFYENFVEDITLNPLHDNLKTFSNIENRNMFNCTRRFKFKPKKINNQINWSALFTASEIVFEALMANIDVDNIIHIVENMSSRNQLYPIFYLFEFLAYHSYDLIYDLSMYSSFDDLDEIENLKKIVSVYIDLKINKKCPWHIIQLYEESLYKINENIVEDWKLTQ